MKNRKIVISVEELRTLLRPDFETGKLYWLHRPEELFASINAAKIWNTRLVGEEAFTATTSVGYKHGHIWGQDYATHRVIWALYHGAWPQDEIDHKNGDRSANWIDNLRPATSAQNSMNAGMLSNNTSGHKGVSWCKRNNKWRACIEIHGKHKYRGLFKNIEDAIAARKAAERELFGDFARK